MTPCTCYHCVDSISDYGGEIYNRIGKIASEKQVRGLYYVDGKLKNTEDTSDSPCINGRNLVAMDNGNTVRMYHYNLETGIIGLHTFKITVNEDNSLSYSTWDQFIIYDGGGVYHPDVELYDFW